MAGKPELSSELSRDLSLFHITMMGLGMMIGAGVFLGTGKSIAIAGPGGVILTFALNGLIAIFTAMSYAELSSAIPRAGGAYNFARIGFGRGTSFVAGWMEWFASSVAGSLYAVCFAKYTMRFFMNLELFDISDTGELYIEKGVTLAVAALFIYINYRGASETGKIGAVMTFFQTLFLLIVGVIGIVVCIKHPDRLHNFQPFLNHEEGGWTALLVTMGFTAVAFEGYEVIAQAGDETINPRQNVPKAMLLSVLIVTFTYVLCAIATVVAVKLDVNGQIGGMSLIEWVSTQGDGGDEVFGSAVEMLMPRGGGLLVMLAVIFASTSALNATVYSATRASYALGRDRMLPAMFSKISKKQKTPWVALTFTGLIVIVMALFLPGEQVTAAASIMFLLLFLLVNLCVIRVRYHMGDELEYGFVMPFFPLLPILAIICQGVLAVHLHELGRTAWMVAGSWIIAGVFIYFLYSRTRVTASDDEIHVFEEDTAEETGGYSIMVPVANPDNALAMIRHTYSICKAKDAHVELLHMVPVPDQVPLSDSEMYMMDGREAICETMLYLSPMFPLSTTIRYCRSVSRGIVSAVREKKTDMLIMGWKGKPRRSKGYILGSTIDPVIERVPCNVLVMKNVGDQKFHKIVVPVAGGPNAAFALEVAGMLADTEDSQIVLLNVSTGDSGRDVNLVDFIDTHAARLGIPIDRLRARTVKSDNVLQAILKEAGSEEEGYDLVVIGCTREPLLYQLTRESVPEQIARLCEKPLIMVKASGGIRSWIRRWV